MARRRWVAWPRVVRSAAEVSLGSRQASRLVGARDRLAYRNRIVMPGCGVLRKLPMISAGECQIFLQFDARCRRHQRTGSVLPTPTGRFVKPKMAAE
ncbi:hypothetical protein [Thiohalocapsa sp. ML1]|uniref:hypothetical protein n=1 Tax=Thiohalocapsa sp. ML1 TaxID=1431688 RepID=UPI00138F8FE0|nr:hypothetical protein [Thiohalocapsa sp. ML1]